MDPTRPRHSPVDRPSTSRRHPDDRNAPPGPPLAQRSLPSIHHLNPDLPPAGMHPPGAGGAGPSSHAHHQPSPVYPPPSGSSLGTRPAPDDRDSDPEGDPHEPPKKKRRRQALSCTECKRRKIKCDRAQPCGPCARRGEHNKCQWHIIEPMEKYVTRTEYDELKLKVHELEGLISRIMQGRFPPPVMTQGSVIEPVQGTTISPYHQTYPANVAVPHHAMSSTRSPTHGEPPPPPGRPPRSGARSPPPAYRPLTSHTPSSSSRSLPTPMSPVQAVRVPRSPTLPTSPHQPSASGSGSPTITTSRRASLSLAAITTPFSPDMQPSSQPKNHYAQTPLLPGQRLRQVQAPSGSAPQAAQGRRRHPPRHTAAARRQATPILA